MNVMPFGCLEYEELTALSCIADSTKGEPDGASDGKSEGAIDGPSEGALVGSEDGASDGDVDGE